MFPADNLSVKFDTNIFTGDWYYGYFTTSLIWLRNALSRPFWWGFLGVDPLNVVGYCRDPQKAHLWPETLVLVHRPCWLVKKCDLGAWRRKQKKERKETQRFDKSHICPDHPRCAIPTKSVMWGGVPDVATVPSFIKIGSRVSAPRRVEGYLPTHEIWCTAHVGLRGWSAFFYWPWNVRSC